MDLPDTALQRSRETLRRLGVGVRPARSPAGSRTRATQPLREAVASFLPAGTAAPRLHAELMAHAQALPDELLRHLQPKADADLGFAREHAQRCAAQRLPLEATLQAHRGLQPVLVAWARQMVKLPEPPRRAKAIAALDAWVQEWLAAVGITFASEYAAHAGLVAEAEGERRTELLNLLLGGHDPADARVARLLKRAGYLEQRLSFCVALAQSTDPLEMEQPARAQRIADALAACVAPLAVRALVGVRGNLVTAVYSDIRRASGWTAPRTSLAARVKEQLLTLGTAVRIGVSGDLATPAHIPRGLHEATVALDFASVAERVVSFHGVSVRRLLIHRGAEFVRPALPAWLQQLQEADAQARGRLVQTLRAMADADINVQRAARQLRVHANTVYARLQRVHDLTNLDAQRFHDLAQLLLALDCAAP